MKSQSIKCFVFALRADRVLVAGCNKFESFWQRVSIMLTVPFGLARLSWISLTGWIAELLQPIGLVEPESVSWPERILGLSSFAISLREQVEMSTSPSRRCFVRFPNSLMTDDIHSLWRFAIGVLLRRGAEARKQWAG